LQVLLNTDELFFLAGLTPSVEILDHLSEDELRKLEGRSKEAIVARLKAIQNIQQQLTGVSTQLTQLLQVIPDYTDGPSRNNFESSTSQPRKDTTVSEKGKEREH
jgi:hypothetical protein